MTKLTEANKVEIRTIFGNNPGMSYVDVANVFAEATGRKLNRSTIMRIIKERDPTAGDTLPSKKRGRGGIHGATSGNIVAQRSLAVVQEPPRTAPLIAGAQNEAAEIMRKLDELLQGQLSRLDEVLAAEKDFKSQVKTKDGEGKYYLALQLNAQHNNAIIGVKATLQQMANMQRNIMMYFDNRQVNVTNNVCPNCSRPLRERMAEYQEIWVGEYEKKIMEESDGSKD